MVDCIQTLFSGFGGGFNNSHHMRVQEKLLQKNRKERFRGEG